MLKKLVKKKFYKLSLLSGKFANKTVTPLTYCDDNVDQHFEPAVWISSVDQQYGSTMCTAHAAIHMLTTGPHSLAAHSLVAHSGSFIAMPGKWFQKFKKLVTHRNSLVHNRPQSVQQNGPKLLIQKGCQQAWSNRLESNGLVHCSGIHWIPKS